MHSLSEVSNTKSIEVQEREITALLRRGWRQNQEWSVASDRPLRLGNSIIVIDLANFR